MSPNLLKQPLQQIRIASILVIPLLNGGPKFACLSNRDVCKLQKHGSNVLLRNVYIRYSVTPHAVGFCATCWI